MKKRNVTLGLIQTKVSENVPANIAKTEKFIRQAAKKGAQIICLQELYNAIYFPQQRKHDVSKFMETIPGESTRRFSVLAKQLGVVIIVPVFEKRKNGKTYNSAVVINTHGKLLPIYNKSHIPLDPGFYERDYFEEGDSGYKIYKTKFATFAVLICFDQWFPEAARMARLGGAEIIFYPTAIGDILGLVPKEGHWHDAWETIQRSHSIANSLVVAVTNRVGVEGKTKFWGQSFISDAFGKVIKRGSATKEQVVIGKVDLNMNKYISDGWGFMRSRRPDTYKLSSTKFVKKGNKLANVEHYKDTKKALGER
jgi:agmatine deiminase